MSDIQRDFGRWTVWCARGIRVETPCDMTMDSWEMLRKYVEVMKPDETNAEPAAAQPPRSEA